MATGPQACSTMIFLFGNHRKNQDKKIGMKEGRGLRVTHKKRNNDEWNGTNVEKN